MSQQSLACSALLFLGGLLVSACGPSESALSVRVLDWPAEATGLRVLTQFGDQAKPAFFVEPGVSDLQSMSRQGRPVGWSWMRWCKMPRAATSPSADAR